MRLCSITPGSTGDWELRVYEIDHAAGSKKSLGVTSPPEAVLIFAANSHEGRVTPRRIRLMAERSTPTSFATPSSLSSPDSIHSLSFMTENVQYMHSACQALCAPQVIDLAGPRAHNARMIEVDNEQNNEELRPTLLRVWRKYRGISQEAACADLGMTRENLSKIERGLVPYGQRLLQRAATLYDCSEADLLERDPRNPVVSTYDRLRALTPEQFATFEKAIKGVSEANKDDVA